MRSNVCPPFMFVRRSPVPRRLRFSVANGQTRPSFGTTRIQSTRFTSFAVVSLVFSVRQHIGLCTIVFYVVHLQRTPLCRLKTNRRPSITGGFDGSPPFEHAEPDSCFVYTVSGPDYALGDFKNCQILLHTHTHTHSPSPILPQTRLYTRCIAPFVQFGHYSCRDNTYDTYRMVTEVLKPIFRLP